MEHDYATPTLDAAEDLVELLRRVCSAMRAASNPSYGAWVFGSFCHSISNRASGMKVEFAGWDKPFLIVQRFCADPWIGVVIPDSKNTAVVRRVGFANLHIAELLDIYCVAERQFGKSRSVNGSDVGRQLSEKMGVIQ